MALVLKRGLDPFEDGSLKFSWIFTDPNDNSATNDSEQSATNTIGAISDVSTSENAPHSLNASTANADSTVAHGFGAGDPFTICFWGRLQDKDERCAVFIGTPFSSTSLGVGYYDGKAVGIFGSSYYDFGAEDDTDYHYFSMTYDGVTAEWFKDGTSQTSHKADINTDATQKVRLYTNDTDVYGTDITVFDRVLTSTEISDLMNDNFAGASENIAQPDVINLSIYTPRATTQWSWLNRGNNPFGDNSDVAMWTFTDNDTGDAIIDCVEGGNTFSSLSNVVEDHNTPYSLNSLQGNSGHQYSQNNQPFSGADDATLTFWIKPDISGTIAKGSVSLGGHFVAKAFGVGWRDSSGVPKYTFQIGTTYYWLNEIVETWEEWQHIAMTIKSDGTIRVTRNGTQMINLTGQTIDFDNTKKIEFYSESNVDYVSDICVWDRVLTDAEIEKLRTDDFVKGGLVSADLNTITSTLLEPTYKFVTHSELLTLDITLLQSKVQEPIIFPNSLSIDSAVNIVSVSLPKLIEANIIDINITLETPTIQAPIIYPNSIFIEVVNYDVVVSIPKTVVAFINEIVSNQYDVNVKTSSTINAVLYSLVIEQLIPLSQGTIIVLEKTSSFFIEVTNPIKYSLYEQPIPNMFFIGMNKSYATPNLAIDYFNYKVNIVLNEPIIYTEGFMMVISTMLEVRVTGYVDIQPAPTNPVSATVNTFHPLYSDFTDKAFGKDGSGVDITFSTDNSGNDGYNYAIFNGTTSHITPSIYFNSNNSHTSYMRFKCDVITSTEKNVLLCKQNSDGIYEFYIYINSDGYVGYYVQGNEGILTNVKINFNSFYHFVLNNGTDVYINGAFAGSVPSFDYSPKIVRIGANLNNTVYHFKGSINMVRGWDGGLTIDEIKSLQDLTFDDLNYITAPQIITPYPTLNFLDVITPNYVGAFTAGTTLTYPTVMAQSIMLRIVPLYLKTRENVYVKAPSLLLQITKTDEPLWSRVFPNSFGLTAVVTSSVAQPYKDKRVVSIGLVTFNEKMLWEQNLVTHTFSAASTKMLDGSTVYSVLPKKQFSRPYKIMSNNVIMLNKVVVNQLKTLSAVGVHKIIFDDGSFEYMKFDLTKKYLEFTPLYDGAEYFYTNIEVLI